MPKTTQSRQEPDGFMRFLVLLTFLVVCFLSVGLLYTWKKVAILETVSTPEPSTPASSITSISYKCDKNKTIQAQYISDRVELELSDGRSFLLMQGMSGSGVRYVNSDESVTFWNKGTTAFIEEKNAMTYANCVEVSQ